MNSLVCIGPSMKELLIKALRKRYCNKIGFLAKGSKVFHLMQFLYPVTQQLLNKPFPRLSQPVCVTVSLSQLFCVECWDWSLLLAHTIFYELHKEHKLCRQKPKTL